MNIHTEKQEELLSINIPRSKIRFSDPHEQQKFEKLDLQQAQEALNEIVPLTMGNSIITFSFN